MLAMNLILLPGVRAQQDSLAPAAYQAASSNYAHASTMEHLWHWPHFPLHVFIATHNAQEEHDATAALDGFDEWVKATNHAVHYIVVDNPALADLTVRFTPDMYLPDEPGVAGETHTAASRGVLRRASMVLATGSATAAELQSTAAHEFGHALGIGGHSDDPDDLMYSSETRYISEDGSPAPTPPHRVTERDLNTLRFCYPALLGA